jgi:4-hydroxy-tetrahydrodipicolinate synthase
MSDVENRALPRTTLREALRGISGILVTPFDGDDRIAPKRLSPIIDRMIVAGVALPTVNGNTGEFYALSLDEAEAMVGEVCTLVAGRVPVLAGVGRSIGEACRLATSSIRAGASALMVHQPPDPFASPRGVVDYVRRVADAAAGVPIVIYLRNDLIGTQAIVDLCAIEGVAGVKWATPNLPKLQEAMSAAPEVAWVDGLAESWAPPMYAVGARGFTSGLVNVWPERSVEILRSLDAGDYVTAGRLIDEIKVFEAIRAEEMNGANVGGVKAALQAVGLDCGPTRPPASWPLSTSAQSRLQSFLGRYDLVK